MDYYNPPVRVALLGEKISSVFMDLWQSTSFTLCIYLCPTLLIYTNKHSCRFRNASYVCQHQKVWENFLKAQQLAGYCSHESYIRRGLFCKPFGYVTVGTTGLDQECLLLFLLDTYCVRCCWVFLQVVYDNEFAHKGTETVCVRIGCPSGFVIKRIISF